MMIWQKIKRRDFSLYNGYRGPGIMHGAGKEK
jgi:hypothetical protein